MVLAISAADPLNVPAGGCVESVVTPRTHLRFRVGRLVEVDGMALVQAAGRCGSVRRSQRSCRLEYSIASAYPGGPILNEVDRFSLFAMLLGILLTAVYLAGFVERPHKTMLRMGIDSIVVLVGYCGGLVLLFFLR
jgi:hypothetical protein